MRIAIPVNENNGLKSTICEHFGHTPFFAFVDLDKEKIEKIDIVKNPFESHAPGEIPTFIKENKANIMVSRGMGGRAVSFFEQFGIKVIKGAYGSVEEIIKKMIEGNLMSIDSYEPPDKEHHHDCQ